MFVHSKSRRDTAKLLKTWLNPSSQIIATSTAKSYQLIFVTEEKIKWKQDCVKDRKAGFRITMTGPMCSKPRKSWFEPACN